MWLNLYIFSTSVLLKAQVKTELPGQQEVLSTNTMYKTKQQVLQWENKPPTALYIKSIYGRKVVAICVLTENIRATKKPTHEGCDMDPYDVTGPPDYRIEMRESCMVCLLKRKLHINDMN